MSHISVISSIVHVPYICPLYSYASHISNSCLWSCIVSVSHICHLVYSPCAIHLSSVQLCFLYLWSCIVSVSHIRHLVYSPSVVHRVFFPFSTVGTLRGLFLPDSPPPRCRLCRCLVRASRFLFEACVS